MHRKERRISHPDYYDADFRLQPLKEFESERGVEMRTERARESIGKAEGEAAFPFFLLEGRLGTSKKQGNHDNQTTNLGRQHSFLTVRARQAAQQGLM